MIIILKHKTYKTAHIQQIIKRCHFAAVESEREELL